MSVAETLRPAILEGRFPSGTQLREVALANELGVSRAPLHEALTILCEAGLVDRRMHEWSGHGLLLSN